MHPSTTSTRRSWHVDGLRVLAVAGALMGASACGGEDDTPQRRLSRSEAYAQEGASPGEPASPGGARPAPPITEDADLLERAALESRPGSTPVGTRAQVLRCQAAMPDADLVFAPSWYAYADHANPDTPIRGCERGDSESMLEALAWGQGRTQLCSIGWRAQVHEGTTYPYAGMGVRTNGGLEGTRRFTLETRSTGEPLELELQLVMDSQQHMPCGDEAKAPYAHPIVCDGTGKWHAQTVELADFAPRWGAPPELDRMSIVAVHVQNRAGYTGPIACDLRIVDAE